MLTQHCHAVGDFFLVCSSRMGKHDAARVGNLIVEKLTKILHIHFALTGIDNSGKCIELCTLDLQILYRSDHVGKLSYA